MKVLGAAKSSAMLNDESQICKRCADVPVASQCHRLTIGRLAQSWRLTMTTTTNPGFTHDHEQLILDSPHLNPLESFYDDPSSSLLTHWQGLVDSDDLPQQCDPMILFDETFLGSEQGEGACDLELVESPGSLSLLLHDEAELKAPCDGFTSSDSANSGSDSEEDSR